MLIESEHIKLFLLKYLYKQKQKLTNLLASLKLGIVELHEKQFISIIIFIISFCLTLSDDVMILLILKQTNVDL